MKKLKPIWWDFKWELLTGTAGIIVSAVFEQWVVLTILVLSLSFLSFFYRRPHRVPDETDGVVLSSADGKVLNVKKVDEPLFVKKQCWAVTVFMSPLNVHRNTSPVEGEVKFFEYQRGKFHRAFLVNKLLENEKNIIGFERDDGVRVLIYQIAGVLARRVVFYGKVGDEYDLGEEIGLVKFGSAVIHLFPCDVFDVAVEEGDVVRAGKTVIGREKNENHPTK